DIEALCRYAHKYWGRVYATVNTIFHDAELPAAGRLIHDLSHAGIDGVIVQDAGLLEMDLPDIPLIASTQMHNHTPERVAFLEAAGFSRVILARELSLAGIAAIRSETSVELECFVHGALCVGYSGQCYLSHAIGGRGANRGACAQPCRRRYSLRDGTGKIIVKDVHLLSLKDLNLSDHLNGLLEAGITSFKIEGRLKDQAYVTNVVGHYRKRLDAVLTKYGMGRASSGDCSLNFTPDPERTFNRGFTTYFLTGRNLGMAALTTPKSMGKRMGAVTSLGKDFFDMHHENEPFHAGDGICFFDASGRLRGTPVNRVERGRPDGGRVYPDKLDGIKPGVLIYRNHDHLFLKHLAKSCPQRKINVSLILMETPAGFILRAIDEDGVQAEGTLNMEKQPAEKPDMALAGIQKQLQKLGATDFVCVDLDVKTAHIYFIPVQGLNELRRGMAANLIIARDRQRPRRKGAFQKNAFPFPEKKVSYLGNVLNRRAAEFYRRHGVTEIEPALESSPESGSAMTDKTVMISKYCILYQLGRCRRDPSAPKTMEPLVLIDENSLEFEIRTRCDVCEMEIIIT
ncbi:MAG: U32 family peptidase, partial [Desulfobacteraceae bacterium]|nr:U32 family peptidase [Desulfobacteraceae bacterium]